MVAELELVEICPPMGLAQAAPATLPMQGGHAVPVQRAPKPTYVVQALELELPPPLLGVQHAQTDAFPSNQMAGSGERSQDQIAPHGLNRVPQGTHDYQK